MAMTATLDSVTRAGDPLMFDLGLTYRNDADPLWKVEKVMRVVIDPALSPANQRAALVTLVTNDLTLYSKQAAVQAALTQLIGSMVTLP